MGTEGRVSAEGPGEREQVLRLWKEIAWGLALFCHTSCMTLDRTLYLTVPLCKVGKT